VLGDGIHGVASVAGWADRDWAEEGGVMGLFNYVNVKMDCPGCGDGPLGFQTKDGDPVMDTVDPDALAFFGAICKKCGLWTGFARELAPVSPRREPFTQGEVEAMGFVMTTEDLESGRSLQEFVTAEAVDHLRQADDVVFTDDEAVARQLPETIMGFPVAAFEEVKLANPEDAARFGSYKVSKDFILVREGDYFIFRKKTGDAPEAFTWSSVPSIQGGEIRRGWRFEKDCPTYPRAAR
jgi:hypothetical protein